MQIGDGLQVPSERINSHAINRTAESLAILSVSSEPVDHRIDDLQKSRFVGDFHRQPVSEAGTFSHLPANKHCKPLADSHDSEVILYRFGATIRATGNADFELVRKSVTLADALVECLCQPLSVSHPESARDPRTGSDGANSFSCRTQYKTRFGQAPQKGGELVAGDMGNLQGLPGGKMHGAIAILLSQIPDTKKTLGVQVATHNTQADSEPIACLFLNYALRFKCVCVQLATVFVGISVPSLCPTTSWGCKSLLQYRGTSIAKQYLWLQGIAIVQVMIRDFACAQDCRITGNIGH